MIRSGRFGTLLTGLRTRIRVFFVLLFVAGAMLPQSLLAQRKPQVSDETLTLRAGDEGKISILGRSLTLFARAEAFSVKSGDSAEGITISFARARGTSRTLTIRTESTVLPGDYTINVVSRARRRTYTLDFTLTVEGDAAVSATLPATGLAPPTTRPTSVSRPRPTSGSRPPPTAATRPPPLRPPPSTAKRNRPPRVISVTPPDAIEAEVAFELEVQAGDDQGLSDVTVAWRGGNATASFSGGTDETVSVSLPGFAAGATVIRVIVRDSDGVRGTAWTGRLSIVAPALPVLSGLILSDETVTEGAVVTARVVLDSPPQAEVEVAISTSGGGAIDFPASVTIPAGSREATVSGVVGAVQRDVGLTVIARYDGAEQRARLSVLGPPTLAEFTLLGTNREGGVLWRDEPGLVRGAGYLVLDRPAPAAGIVVALSSDHPELVTLISEVRITAGNTEARFDVENAWTPTQVDVQIEARVGDTSLSDTYRLKPTSGSIPVELLFRAVGGSEAPSISVVSGETFTATVVFNRPVGPDGFDLYIDASGQLLIQGGLRHKVPAGSERFDVQMTAPEVSAAYTSSIRAEEDGSIIRIDAEVEVLPASGQLASVSFDPTWTLPGGPPVIATVTFSESAPIDRTVTLSGTLQGGVAWQKSLTVPSGQLQGQLLVTNLDDIQQSVATDEVEVTATFMESTASTTVTLHRTAKVDRVEMSTNDAFYGEEVTATVTLRDPAAPGGFELKLVGAGRGILSDPPATVLVAAGEISVAIPLVSNRSELGRRSVDLELRNDRVPTFGFNFQLHPAPRLNGITHATAMTAPGPVLGGTSGEVALILFAAPPRPVSISLTSSDPSVISVPSEVTASAVRTAIPIQALMNPGPGETETATITASLGDQEVSRVLTVIPRDPSIVSMEVLPHSPSGELFFYPGETFRIRVMIDRDLRGLDTQATFAASEPELLVSLAVGDASSQILLEGQLATFDAPRILRITGDLAGVESSVDVQLIMPSLESFELYDTGSPDEFLSDLVFPLPYTKCAMLISIPKPIMGGFGLTLPLSVTTSRPDLMQVEERSAIALNADQPGIKRLNVDCNVAGSGALISEPTPITIEITVGGGVTVSKTVTLHPEGSEVGEIEEAEVLFTPVSVTSDALMMTGQRFQPVSVTSDALVMTGERFQPVSVTSDALMMTGERFQPVSVTSDALMMTGQRGEEETVVDTPPTIDSFDLPAEAVANTDVEVVVSASDDNGLLRIDVLYESDDRPGRPSLARVSVVGQRSVTETILLNNVSVGTQRIRVLVHDEAGGRTLGTEQMVVVAPEPAPVLEALSAPDELTIGETSVVGVTLDRAAPGGGAEVEITGDSETLSVADNILLIPEGATYGEVRVSISRSASAGVVETITATYGGTRLSSDISVIAVLQPRLLQLDVPASLRPGESSVIGVTLDRPAPFGGTEVSISVGSKNLTTTAPTIFVSEGDTFGEVGVSAALEAEVGLDEEVTATLGDQQLRESVLLVSAVASGNGFQPITENVGSFQVIIEPITLVAFQPVSVSVGAFQVVIEPIAPEAFSPVTIDVGSFQALIVPLSGGGG